MQVRIFIFILFNEIYFAMALFFIYFYAKYRELQSQFQEVNYVIKSIGKRSKQWQYLKEKKK